MTDHHYYHYHCVINLLLTLTFFYLLPPLVFSTTDPGDLAVLIEFKKGLKNPELLNWPENGGDPCGSPRWPHVFCTQSRVSQIQVQGMNLKGPLPSNLNQLSMLTNLGLQKNQFTGSLPSFKGLSELRWAYLDYNLFDEIPADFFQGLDSLEVLALDNNPLNASGWSIPVDLQNSAQLQNLSLMSCNLVGNIPDFLGSMSSLGVLKLSMNQISGPIPSTFNGSVMRILWLNGQSGGGMSGGIDVIGTMSSLTSVWLHGNHFSGRIPESIGELTELKDFNVNSNDLVGLVPDGLAGLSLDKLDLNNNQFMGPVPKFKAVNFTYSSNQFCVPDPGVACAPEVTALLGFLDNLNYPSRLVSSWSGNDPCGGSWVGLTCSKQKVSSIHLARFNLSGILSPSIANLDGLTRIDLGSNNLMGMIPSNWSSLKSLTFLDLSNNDLSPPVPNFNPDMKLVLTGNPFFQSNSSKAPPKTIAPVGSAGGGSPPDSSHPSPRTGTGTGTGTGSSPVVVSGDSAAPLSAKKSKKKSNVFAIIAPVVCFAILTCLITPVCIYLCKKKKVNSSQPPSSLVIHPRDPFDSDNTVKISIANDTQTQTSIGSGSAESHVIESGNLIISVQVLKNVTKNFAHENELGRGGFGVVYKGQLDDGTKIAVKRMESGVISNKALDEFQSEIAVLSKVRHRHLVSLLGYSTEGVERILVYEYMPQGALSRHLFHWKNFKLEPLSWKRRLNIALDVARGMEYLHTLAHQSFIHRDLKSSNILLGDDFRAKVSDFGLVKLAPDGAKSVITRLAGTFGYLAPEYAVTGKVTTKVDVFSYGVVLMELLTGLMALDEDRPEESQYLAAWFWSIRTNKEKLMAAVDPALNANEETFETISVIAELAGHCTAREPSQRPDMGHAVNVLAPLVEKWKPVDNEDEEYCGIDYSLPLTQMVKGWQEAEGKDYSSYVDLDDSKSSIPARPAGFADSFTSADGR